MKKFVCPEFGLILIMGFAIIITQLPIKGLIGDCFSVTSVGIEERKGVIEAFIAFNIALLGLIPVVISHVNSNVKNAKIGNKQKKRVIGLINDMLDDFCRGTVLWCALLLVSSIVFLVLKSCVLFRIIAAFEFALLIVWVLWILNVMPKSWPKTYTENKLKK